MSSAIFQLATCELIQYVVAEPPGRDHAAAEYWDDRTAAHSLDHRRLDMLVRVNSGLNGAQPSGMGLWGAAQSLACPRQGVR